MTVDYIRRCVTEVRCDEKDGRLPRPSPFTPIHYNLELKPDIYRHEPPFPFSGRVSIYVRCEVETRTMTLNINGQNIVDQSIAVDSGTDQVPEIADVSL